MLLILCLSQGTPVDTKHPATADVMPVSIVCLFVCLFVFPALQYSSVVVFQQTLHIVQEVHLSGLSC